MLEQLHRAYHTNLVFRAIHPVSLHPILALGGGGALGGLAFGIWLLNGRFHTMLYVFWWMTLALTLTVPVVVAGMTALETSKDIRGGQYQLLYMTPLSEEALVWGYILRGLYRLRWWLSLLIGMLPLVVVSSFYTILRLYIGVASFNSYVPPKPPRPLSILIPTFFFLLFTVGLWGANVLGALIGVQSALRWEGEINAGVRAMALALVCMGLLGFGVGLAIVFPQGMQLAMIFCAPSQFILFFTLAWERFMRQAQRYMRLPEV